MAPAPLATPRATLVSDKLRALATELAQKMVERVRVGTNELGNSEFQIDLRSEVLAGLQIRVSCGKGRRISASFSSADVEVLKQLKAEAEGLRKALTARGLTLDEIKIEERR
jgi:hypothetical protein